MSGTPTRLADRVAGWMRGSTLSRRSFLTRTAVVGSALAVAPRRFLLEPFTAYAAITDLCGPGNECADGWTAFCCSVNNGVNECPPGTTAGGWWRADGSSWCCGGARYYIDCHAGCSQPVCDGPDYICPPELQLTSHCNPPHCNGGGTCDHRRVCVNSFRYGNCGDATTCMSSVVCRMVSCTPPYLIPGLECRSQLLTESRTAEHGAPCLHQASWEGGATAIRPETVTESPAVATVRGSSRADVFAPAPDGTLRWTTQSGVLGDWSTWISLAAPPGGFQGSPAAVAWTAQRIDVFVWGNDGKLWQRFTETGGVSWSPWLRPVGDDGTLASSPAAVSWGPGRTNIFVVGTDGVVYERFEDHGVGWNHAWLPQGRPPAGIAGHLGAASWGPGHIVLFARGATDNRLWSTYQVGHGWLGSWFKPPGTEDGTLASSPAGASWGEGENAVFTRGTDGALYWTHFYKGGFGGWEHVGLPGDVIASAPAGASRGCQQLDVLARGPDHRVVRFRYQG